MIGRADSRKLDGQTVCLGCYRKSGADEVQVTPKQTVFVTVVSAAITAVVLGTIIWAIKWLAEAAF